MATARSRRRPAPRRRAATRWCASRSPSAPRAPIATSVARAAPAVRGDPRAAGRSPTDARDEARRPAHRHARGVRRPATAVARRRPCSGLSGAGRTRRGGRDGSVVRAAHESRTERVVMREGPDGGTWCRTARDLRLRGGRHRRSGADAVHRVRPRPDAGGRALTLDGQPVQPSPGGGHGVIPADTMMLVEHAEK